MLSIICIVHHFLSQILLFPSYDLKAINPDQLILLISEEYDCCCACVLKNALNQKQDHCGDDVVL